MKITISPWSMETLWGFAKLGMSISQELKCGMCGKWCKIKTIPNKRLEELGKKK